MSIQQQIAEFLRGSSFAVVGASTNRNKYGNRVLRFYQELNLNVVPVNPRATSVEGLSAVASLSDLDTAPHGISIITPPAVTEHVVQEAIALGIRHIWMQPGAESELAVDVCNAARVNLLHSGPCILVDVRRADVL